MLLSILLLLSLDPRIIAHRGGAGHWPENSLEAFRNSIAAGVRILETDAVLTQDNRIALNHDLTTPIGPIRLRNFADLNRPALEDLFALLKGNQVEVLLETKMAADSAPDFVPPALIVREMDRLIRQHGLSSRIILQSFDHRTLVEMRKLNPQVRLCPLNPRTRLPDYLTPAKALGAHFQFINFRLITANDIDALHAAGIKVLSGTTSDPAEWTRLLKLGVDGILTDNPLDLGKLIAAQAY